MRFRLYREYGALNSPPVFDAVEHGLRQQGHDIVNDDEDVSVIWSVLWSGRMRQNKLIYERCQQQGKPILIIEVGNLKRGETWRICLNHINNLGKFANEDNLDISRPQKLGMGLKQPPAIRRGEILIACQHQESLQWQGMPAMKDWVADTIEKIKQHTHRRIRVRYHPRSAFPFKQSGVEVERPTRIPNTYDDFDNEYKPILKEIAEHLLESKESKSKSDEPDSHGHPDQSDQRDRKLSFERKLVCQRRRNLFGQPFSSSTGERGSLSRYRGVDFGGSDRQSTE